MNDRLRTLLVEDEPGYVRHLQEMLAVAGGASRVVITVANDLKDALARLSERRPDVIFLDEPDFAQAERIASALNTFWNGASVVSAVDAGRVALNLDQLPAPGGFARAMASLEEVAVEPTVVAKVVINERTGTLVAGGEIRMQPATVSHGNLHVRVESSPLVSQPAPFSDPASRSA